MFLELQNLFPASMVTALVIRQLRQGKFPDSNAWPPRYADKRQRIAGDGVRGSFGVPNPIWNIEIANTVACLVIARIKSTSSDTPGPPVAQPRSGIVEAVLYARRSYTPLGLLCSHNSV